MDKKDFIKIEKKKTTMQMGTFQFSILMICMSVLVVLCFSIIIESFVTKSLPRVEVKDMLGNSGEIYSSGKYEKGFNKITIYSWDRESDNTLIHEYGHYIYEKLMTKKEKEYFNENICNDIEIKGYEEDEICSEQFARQFQEMVSRYGYTESEYDYVNKMYSRYVK